MFCVFTLTHSLKTTGGVDEQRQTPLHEENVGEKLTYSTLCTSTHFLILSFPLTTGGKCVCWEGWPHNTKTSFCILCEILCCHINMRTFMLYNVNKVCDVYLYIKDI